MSDKALRLWQACRCFGFDFGMGGRRKLKAAAVRIALGYCSLLVYQGGVTANSQETRQGTVQVSDLTIEPVTKTTIYDSVQSKNLKDVFISVKTTKHYQYTRLPIILKTWFQLAREQIWFFTDTENRHHQNQTNGHMVNTNCSPTHSRQDLCCKTSAEYDHFLDIGKKWFCHFDDDNYVNVPRLVSVLQKYNHQDDWYLGRKSWNVTVKIKVKSNKLIPFWFAHGGAGFCISRSLALKMLPVASGGRFISICETIRLADDMTMGYIIEHLMKTNMTLVPEFHSHLEEMKLLPSETFREQISFGYYKSNVVNVPGGFDTKHDPSRFLSLHCFLFPQVKICLKLNKLSVL